MTPLPGQYFCKKCMRPIKNLRNEGLCDSCMAKQLQAQRLGNFCDHCGTPGTKSMLYINKKTKKKYCVECRAEFRRELINKGIPAEEATRIMISDFILINDPMKRTKVHRKRE